MDGLPTARRRLYCGPSSCDSGSLLSGAWKVVQASVLPANHFLNFPGILMQSHVPYDELYDPLIILDVSEASVE